MPQPESLRGSAPVQARRRSATPLGQDGVISPRSGKRGEHRAGPTGQRRRFPLRCFHPPDWWSLINACDAPNFLLRRVYKERHGIKGFLIPTKSFVKIGIPKIFCYNNKMFGCCSKIFGCTNKKFVVPNFVAVTKPFFSVKSVLWTNWKLWAQIRFVWDAPSVMRGCVTKVTIHTPLYLKWIRLVSERSNHLPLKTHWVGVRAFKYRSGERIEVTKPIRENTAYLRDLKLEKSLRSCTSCDPPSTQLLDSSKHA